MLKTIEQRKFGSYLGCCANRENSEEPREYRGSRKKMRFSIEAHVFLEEERSYLFLCIDSYVEVGLRHAIGYLTRFDDHSHF